MIVYLLMDMPIRSHGHGRPEEASRVRLLEIEAFSQTEVELASGRDTEVKLKDVMKIRMRVPRKEGESGPLKPTWEGEPCWRNLAGVSIVNCVYHGVSSTNWLHSKRHRWTNESATINSGDGVYACACFASVAHLFQAPRLSC